MPQGPQEGLRERRQQVPRPVVRPLRPQAVHVPPGRVLRRDPQAALLQGRQEGATGEVRGRFRRIRLRLPGSFVGSRLPDPGTRLPLGVEAYY